MTGRYEVISLIAGSTVTVVVERTNDRERAKTMAHDVPGWVCDTETGEVYAPSIRAWVRREDCQGPEMDRLLRDVLAHETTGSPSWRTEL